MTASVDQIRRVHPIDVEHDLTLKGQVAWVGRSSMQIQIDLIDKDAPARGALLSSIFTFVARDRNTGKAAPINALQPTSEDEIQRFKQAEARVAKQKAARTARTAEEQLEAVTRRAAQVRELLVESQPYLTMPSLAAHTAMLMRDTRTSNALLCQPQQRNTAGRIFGGFLMRRAFVSTRTFQL